MASPGQKPLQNPQRERFAREYSRHGKGERAVVAAGYKVKTWKQHGSSSASAFANLLLKDSKVLQRIQYIQENRARSADFAELKVLRELKRIAFADIRRLYDEHGNLKPVTEWDADIAAAVGEIQVEKLFGQRESGRKGHIGYTVKVKTNDKLKALEKLMQYFSMITLPDEKTNLTVNDNRQVNYYLPENPRHAQPYRDQPEPAASTEPEPSHIQLPAKRNGSNGSH